jgi:hypothetical protein
MVEIAIALGVIGFALVAIIGILPSGLQVQRDNRAETIINQDGTFWIEAIRSGAKGLDDLTNYVDSIKTPERTYVFGAAGFPQGEFLSGSNIISLLTCGVTNADPDQAVQAVVTAFSGSAAEKEYDKTARDLSFKYRMTVNITNAAYTTVSFSALAPPDPAVQPMESLFSLYEIRVTLEYPYLDTRATDPKYSPPRRQSYRALVSRQLAVKTDAGINCYFLEP